MTNYNERLDKPINQHLVCLWQLQDIEETIQDASPEEMPELYDKLEALSSGLTEAIKKLITNLQRQHERELVEAKREAISGMHDSIMRGELPLRHETDDAFNYGRIHRWIDRNVAELTNQEG